jgi:hypothetical protein
MVRICTEEYEPPSRENRKNAFMHLSNFSLNKYSKEFNQDENIGNKRKFSSFLET